MTRIWENHSCLQSSLHSFRCVSVHHFLYLTWFIPVRLYICFPLQCSLAMLISLDLLLLYPCRLQVVEYIHIEYFNLLLEINYNWHLWEKKEVTFLSSFAFWKVSCRISPHIPPVSTCTSCSFPCDSRGTILFCLFKSLFSSCDWWRNRCLETLEVTVASLQREWTFLCPIKWLDLMRFSFNW